MRNQKNLPPHQVLELLRRLSETESEYPADLLQRQRVAFAEQVNGIKIPISKQKVRPLKNIIPASIANKIISSFLGICTIGLTVAVLFTIYKQSPDPYNTEHELPTTMAQEDNGSQEPSSDEFTFEQTTPSPSQTSSPTQSLTPLPSHVQVLQGTPTTSSEVIFEVSQDGKNNQGKHLGQTPTPPAKRETKNP